MKADYKEKLYKFKVPKYDPSQLVAKAVQDYEWYKDKKVNLESIADWDLNNILLNYIRHRMVKDYDKNCWSKSFQKDQNEYFKWFKAINSEIAKQYPFLQGVVAAQISRKRKEMNIGAIPNSN